jgi:hypothetical protein
MIRSFSLSPLLLVSLSFATPLRAEEAPPEALLSSGTQLYFRWDGGEAHQAARAKSALGQTLREDAGTFLVNLFPQIIESVASNQTAGLLKKGVERSQLEKTQRALAAAPKLVELLGKHGLVVAAEARLALPPDIQASLIVPGAGADPEPLFSTVRLFALLSELEVRDGKFAGRSAQYLNLTDQPTAGKKGKSKLKKPEAAPQPSPAPKPGEGKGGGFPVHLVWWVEGSHAVLALGTRSPEGIVQRFQEKGPRLPENPLFQKVRDFKEFETGIRGFVDVASLVKIAGTVPGIAPILESWGLPGFKSMVLQLGYDGEFTRTLAELDVPSPRKGIMRMFGGKPFTLADLPPVPPDAQQFIMFNLNPAEVFDAVGQALAKQSESAAAFQDFLKSINEAFDINLRTDLLDALGDRMAIYASPADGVLFSQVGLIQVKDPGKLEASLDHALKSLAIGGSIRMKKKPFRDFQIRQVHLKQGSGFPFVPSVAVYKNWLVLGFTPQAVQGFILRATGELPAWKPEAQVQAALDRLPKEFTLLSVSDPRPTIKQVLAIVPLAVGFASAFPGSTEPSFDVGTLPNAHLAVKHLFPNAMVWTDDGTRIRVDSRGALELPIGFTGLDSYGTLLLSFLFRFGG